MADKQTTCGDFGGRNRFGEPCSRTGPGLCWRHARANDKGKHKTCGDFGGKARSGKPCSRPSDGGLCSFHASQKKPPAYEKGRPDLLTDSVRNKILGAVKCGVRLEVACVSNGVAYRTLHEWLGKARESPEGPLGRFLLEVAEAEAYAESQLLQFIHKSAEGWAWVRRRVKVAKNDEGEYTEETTTEGSDHDWRAAAWILERTSKHYRPHMQISGDEDGAPIAIASQVHVYLPDNGREIRAE